MQGMRSALMHGQAAQYKQETVICQKPWRYREGKRQRERGGRAEELTARREGGGRCQGLIARKGVGLLLARSQSRNPASRLRQWLDCSSAGAHLLQTDGADMPTSCLLACLWSSSPTVLAMQLVMAACESHERLWNISPHTSTTPLHTPTERHGTFAVSSQCKRSDTHSLAATPC